MSTPAPGTRDYRNTTVRLADLTVTADLLQSLTFENCVIMGPAVLGIVQDVTISDCSFDAPDASALFWPIPKSRPIVMGIIEVIDVRFYFCRFQRVGIAAPEDSMFELQNGFQS